MAAPAERYEVRGRASTKGRSDRHHIPSLLNDMVDRQVGAGLAERARFTVPV